MDNRAEIKDFLTSRRARLTPSDVGLPHSTRRRVKGLRREEVAVLAGVSTEWYIKLERGNISGVSEEVLNAVAQALRLSEEEYEYFLDLARSARPLARKTTRRREAPLGQPIQWMLDSVTMSAAFVRNGRLDVVGVNPLARVLHAPMFESPTTTEYGVANFARYHFLDDGSRDFFVEWQAGAEATVALLRAEVGREPRNRPLRELIGELSTLSEDFRTMWAAHDVRGVHAGTKKLQHPEVGELELAYRSADLHLDSRTWYDLSFYTAEPGTVNEEKMKLLSSLVAHSHAFDELHS